MPNVLDFLSVARWGFYYSQKKRELFQPFYQWLLPFKPQVSIFTPI